MKIQYGSLPVYALCCRRKSLFSGSSRQDCTAANASAEIGCSKADDPDAELDPIATDDVDADAVGLPLLSKDGSHSGISEASRPEVRARCSSPPRSLQWNINVDDDNKPTSIAKQKVT